VEKQSNSSRNNYKTRGNLFSPTVTLLPLGLFSRFQKSQFLKFTSQKLSAPDYYFTVTSTSPSKTLSEFNSRAIFTQPKMFRVTVLAACAALAVYALPPTRTSNKNYGSSNNAYNAYAACPFHCDEDQLVSVV
jgi:hypothetical protein